MRIFDSPDEIFIRSKLLIIVGLSFFLFFTVLAQSLSAQNVDAQRLYTSRIDTLPDTDKAPSTHGIADTNNDRITARTATLHAETCVTYEPFTKLIKITCRSANLTDLDKALKNPSVIKNEGGGVWLLNANLSIADGANFTIDSNDTKWLKINSTSSEDVYHIDIIGNMKIDSVKISSWNTTSNNYTTTDGKVHRPSIVILPKATGRTDITNSEIGYLGYPSSLRLGLSYLGGVGGLIKNNTIHNMWNGFYSKSMTNATIEDNHFYDNVEYGLSHTSGTRDLVIRNNRVHDNGNIGISCSVDCKNITIEGNNVYENTDAGISIKYVRDSIIRNNSIQEEITGISIPYSATDEVYGNTISNTDKAIRIRFNSSNNSIYDNSIYNSAKCGIEFSDTASNNTIHRNSVLNSTTGNGICILGGPSNNTISANEIYAGPGYAIYAKDSNSGNNVLIDNQLLNVSRTPTRVLNSTLILINNTLTKVS
jgi:poly(beta-D-mannuronate) C5 epimerase